jgi:hypothetical protein
MELSKWEEMLIVAARRANEVPGNVMLWYEVGLQDAADKIKDLDINRYNTDMERIRIFKKTYKEYNQ